jgi:hypothetical protein
MVINFLTNTGYSWVLTEIFTKLSHNPVNFSSFLIAEFKPLRRFNNSKA